MDNNDDHRGGINYHLQVLLPLSAQWPRLWAEGRAVATALSSLAQQPDASATITRTLVRWPGDDRVNSYLLLRGLDDTHIRKSVLGLRHRPDCRGKIKPMIIDWFTIFAQVLNFLILVWLMKRFLYKPIRSMPSTRGRSGLPQNSRMPIRKNLTHKKRVTSLERKNKEFEQQRAALLSKATEEAQSRSVSVSLTKRGRRPWL